jgi:hypothetical protein
MERRGMIVRVTGKLAKQVGIDPMDALPLAENPLVDWTYRTFSPWENQMYMLITNTASLYSMLAPANDLEAKGQFVHGLVRYLEQKSSNDGFGEVFDRQISPELNPVKLTKSRNRSVTGSMTDMVRLSEHMLFESQDTLEQIGASLNQTPCGALDYAHPRERFVALAT